MCGIVGFAGHTDEITLRRMNDILQHRGPDDAGTFIDERGVFLAMRRLSIIDLTTGHQPMCNEDRSVWIVFNGEIYNSPMLRKALLDKGHTFQTKNSDTECLIHLYEDKGPEMLSDLNGMFAFAIYDKRKQLIFCARDRMGIKPFYFWQGVEGFAFASELKSLFVLPFISREVNYQSVYHYMTLLYIPAEDSAIKGVSRLGAGHYLLYDIANKKCIKKRYWQLPVHRQCIKDYRDVPGQLREMLRQAVKRWSLSDVPLACSLSGGIDSSAIVGLLSEQGIGNLQTYSLGFVGEQEQSWSEVHLAAEVARKWGTDHHEMYVDPEELLRDLVHMVWHLDEPYAGGLPSWYVFREMSRHVKVGFTGTGGDELFGNYGKFGVYENSWLIRNAMLLRMRGRTVSDLCASVAQTCARATRFVPANVPWVGKGRALEALPELLARPFGRYYYANKLYIDDRNKRSSVFQEGCAAMEDTEELLQRLFDESSASDIRGGLASVDFRTQLAEEFLFMTDRFSMAHSLEARVPFLDHELVEFVYSIPSSIRTKSMDLKYLFKEAISDLLPERLLTERKRGFVLPVEVWLRRELKPLVNNLLSPERLQSQGVFRPEFYFEFVKPHLEGTRSYTWQIWAALMFQLWHVVYIEQDPTREPSYDWKTICTG